MRSIVPIHRRVAQPVPVRHTVPAWPGRPNADAPISFADVADESDEPDWASNSPVAFDASLLEPLEQTDWSAQLAADWEDINAQHASFSTVTHGACGHLDGIIMRDVVALTRLLFIDLADFAAELDDDCAALFADINAERVLFDDAAAELKARVA